MAGPAQGGEGQSGPTAALVGVEIVRPLRHAVLRPGWPEDDSVYPGDDDPGAAHAAVCGPGPGEVLAVGTVLVEPAPWAPGAPGWRIRGMATAEGRRGTGLGRLVLDALLAHVRAGGGGVVWCNARRAAAPFYERAGFVGRGEEFDLPGIGVHRQMWRDVEGVRT